MAKKEEKKLNPTIENKSEGLNFSKEDMQEYADKIESSMEVDTGVNDSSDSFFREVVKSLSDAKNISLKTEYLDVDENYDGARLEFLSKWGGMPYLKDFIHTLEIKRVSLERKGRIELIRTMEKRDEDLRLQQQNQFKNMLGMG